MAETYTHTELLTALALGTAGGSRTDAAEALGIGRKALQTRLRKRPELLALASETAERMAGRGTQAEGEAEVAAWRDMHREARAKIRELMRTDDTRVQLQAAQAVIERVEGRVPQRIDAEVRDPRAEMASAEMRLVASLHLTRGLSVAEAMEYARSHPDEVRAWAERTANGAGRA